MAREKGWHPEDIKAAIRKKGITLTELSIRNGLGESTVRQAILYQHCPSGERVIIEFLNIHPHKLWPQRYDRDGNRIIGNARGKSTESRQGGHCEKEAAA